MLIAKKTAYLRFDGDYSILRRKGGGCCSCRNCRLEGFVCGEVLWGVFPLSGPAPKVIRIELHDVPARDRVEIVNTHYIDVANAAHFDSVGHPLYTAGYQWLLPHLEKHGTVYAEVWY